MFNEKLPDGALHKPTGGTQEPDISINVRDDKVEGFTLVDVPTDESDAVIAYSVEVMTSHKGVLTETVEGINLGPSQAASQVLGRVIRQDFGTKPDDVTVNYQVISCTEIGRLPLK